MNDAVHSATRSYRSGSWYAIFGEHASVLLPESEKPRVAALWELVDGGAEFDELLDALIATGLRSLPGFVLVSTAADPTRLVLRGAAKARVRLENGESVEVDGGAAATWVEQALSGVATLQLVLEEEDGEGDPVDFGIRGGLVRVSRVDQPPYAAEAGTAEQTEPEQAQPEQDQPGQDQPESAQPALAVVADPSPESPAESPAEDTATEAAPEGPADETAGEPADEAADEAAAPVMEQPVEQDQPVEESAPEPTPAAEQPAPAAPMWGAPVAPAAKFSADLPADDPAQLPFEQQAEQPADQQPVDQQPAEGQPAEEQPTDEADDEDDSSTEKHAFPFFNDPEPSGEMPVLDPQAPEHTAHPAQESQQPPAEPQWGQPPAGNVYTPAEAPANPFAPGADTPADPPMWEPPAADAAPQWGPPQGAPAWGDQQGGESIEHDGNTQSGGYDSNEFARQHPGIPGQPQAPSVTAQPVARLVFSNGETIDVDRAVLVGRAPEARRFTSTEQPRLVTVSSPNQEISSTHLEVRPGSGVDHGSAIVTDMGSTNGTVLTQPGFAPEDLQPGIAVQLLPGSVIDLGDGVTIQVTSV